MTVTLDAVLARRELQLRLVWADEAAGARPWGWVHSSDLTDPTPFLSPGDALLTTGTQWRGSPRPGCPRSASAPR